MNELLTPEEFTKRITALAKKHAASFPEKDRMKIENLLILSAAGMLESPIEIREEDLP